MEYLFAFGSTHKALKAEGILKDAGFSFRLLPAPKALAEYCGLVISVDETRRDEAMDFLRSSGAGPRAIYRKEGEDYVKV